jgi:hypothetical protein
LWFLWRRKRRRDWEEGGGEVVGSVERVKRRRVVNRRRAHIEIVDWAFEIIRDFDDEDDENEDEDEDEGEDKGKDEGEVSFVLDLSCGNNTKRRLMLFLLVLFLLGDFGDFVIVKRNVSGDFFGGVYV